MMKTMKRVGALLLVVAMVLALGVSAFATSDATKSSDYTDDYTITIENTTKGQTYSAYQILDATWVDTDGDGETDNVAYTIQPDSPWFYIISQGSNLNTSSGADQVFTLQAVYDEGWNESMKGSEDHIKYYTVTASGEGKNLDNNTATDVIIDYLLANIHIITEKNPDYEENALSTGKAWIYVDDQETKYLLSSEGTEDELFSSGEYSGVITPVTTGIGTGASLTLNLGSDAAGYYFVTTTTGTTVSVTTADPDATIIDKNIIPGSSTPPPGDEEEPGDGTPWLDKYIVVDEGELGNHEDLSGNEEDEDEYEWDYAMGDDVVFNVTSDVPLYADSNKTYPSNEDDQDDVNNAELVYEYVFTDQMTDGVNIKLSREEVATIGESGADADTYVFSTTDSNGTVHYYLTDAALNDWITITDGSSEWDETTKSWDPSYVFTQVTYDYSFELYNLVAVCNPKDGDNSGKYYTVPADEVTEDDDVAYYAASGFKLVYYTYDVDAYYEAIGKWLTEHAEDLVWDEENQEWVKNTYSWTNLPDEALAAGWKAAYTDLKDGYKYPATAEILIEYNAVISDAAVYDNVNTVTMDYYVVSWDYYPPVGEVNPESPDEPPENPPDGPNDGTPGTHSGQTVKNDIFTWELQINKVDAEDGETPLEGAVFTLEGSTLDRVKVTTYTYTLAEEVTNERDDYGDYDTSTEYWLLADGTYVTENPAGSNNADLYDADNPGPYYRKSDYVMEEGDSENFYAYGTTDAEGHLTFSGLKEGKYVLTEIIAPDGYNVLSDPIYFEVVWYDAGESYTNISGGEVEVEEPVYVITFYSDSGYSEATSVSEVPLGSLGNATYVETIENVPGTLLPGTGGIGTTIFYIIGGCLVVGAVVVLVTRKRVGKEEEA